VYVKRDIGHYFDKIKGLYNTIAVVGPRQSGKTTFLKKRIKMNISYLLMDDIDVRSLFEEDVKGFENRYLRGNDVTIMDEVQVCKDAGINLKYLNDSENKMWITSSSEVLLGKEVLSYLVGRVSIVRLYPFSLSEYLRCNNYGKNDKIQVLRSIRELSSYGGYPRVALERDPELKTILLRDLYETMVLRDISKVFNINDIVALERSVKYLANMYTGQLSMENMSKDVAISFKTLRSYLTAMEKSYLIKLVKPYFTNQNKELIKQPKAYFIDNGMRNVISGNLGREMDGASFENLVFTELIKYGYEPRYWRKKTGVEVDFIIELGSEIIPIEVKLKVPEKRIESGLRSFIDQYSPKRALVVTSETDRADIEVSGTTVSFMDLVNLKEELDMMK
jgi:predicted AAA+ superfamily ATPase